MTTKKEAEERKQRILALYDQPRRPTLDEIAKRVSVTKQYASQILTKAGRQPLATESLDVSEIISEIQELGDLTYQAIAEILGISREMVGKWAASKSTATLTNTRRLETLLTALQHAAKCK
jgi:transcriptional regulator with XRE-family HTH domain